MNHGASAVPMSVRLLDAVVGGRIPGRPGQRAWPIAIPIPPCLVFRSTFPNADPHRHIPVMASQSIMAPSRFRSACGDRRASIHLHLIPITLACPRGDGRSSGPSRESRRWGGDMPDMVFVEGGRFLMGSDRHYPEEAPQHSVEVGSFFIDPRPVTNRQFAEFVRRPAMSRWPSGR